MRAVLFTGGVETLDYFSLQLEKAFLERGLKTYVLDLREAEAESRRLKKFIKTGETFVLTFNFEGLEREKGLYTLRDSYLWQQYRVPVYNIAVDHPLWYENRFSDLLEDEEHHPGLLKYYHHFSIDRNHEAYLKSYYPEFQSAGFLPLAGTGFQREEPMLPPGKRKKEIVLAGHYTELPYFEKSITAINEEYEAFYRGIISDYIQHPNRTVEDIVLSAVRKETKEEGRKPLRNVLYHMAFIDLYVRHFYRGLAVATLADAGLPVRVIGCGWEKLPLKHPGSLQISPKTNSVGVLNTLCESKIAFNVLPFFKDGAHDRVFNSILCGAVVLSDPSKYLKEELPEGSGVCYYTLEELRDQKTEELLSCADRLLSSDTLCQEILERGIGIVRSRHTWDARSDRILESVKKELKK